MRTHADR